MRSVTQIVLEMEVSEDRHFRKGLLISPGKWYEEGLKP